MEKLEWCGYTTVKKIEDMFTCFDRIHERVGQTDKQSEDIAGKRRKDTSGTELYHHVNCAPITRTSGHKKIKQVRQQDAYLP